jgi:hypothetical protein
MNTTALLIGVMLVVVQGYGQTNNGRPRATTSTQSADNQQILDLEKRISELEKKVSSLESQASFNKYLIDQKQARYDSIQLDPSSPGFQRLDTDDGSFLVSVANVAPYLNGYKVTINIGNPSNATFRGAKVKVRWAKTYDFNNFTAASYKQWNDSVQTKEIALTEGLESGTWNAVDLLLVPSTSEQLGFLELSMTTEQVVLHTQIK